MDKPRVGRRTLDWLRDALRLYVERGSPSGEMTDACPARDLVAIAEELGKPPDELRALAVIEGMHVAIDAAAVAVLLADSQRQLAMTWGAELADALRIERLSPMVLPSAAPTPALVLPSDPEPGDLVRILSGDHAGAVGRIDFVDDIPPQWRVLLDGRFSVWVDRVEAVEGEALAPAHHAWNDALGIWFCDTDGCTEHLRGDRR